MLQTDCQLFQELFGLTFRFEGDAIKPDSLSKKYRQQARRPLLLAVFSVLACLASGWLGLQAAYPFVTAAHWRAANDEIDRKVRRYRIQNQRDEREIRMLDTPEGIRRAARQLGYVDPGERPLRVPTDQQ